MTDGNVRASLEGLKSVLDEIDGKEFDDMADGIDCGPSKIISDNSSARNLMNVQTGEIELGITGGAIGELTSERQGLIGRNSAIGIADLTKDERYASPETIKEEHEMN